MRGILLLFLLMAPDVWGSEEKEVEEAYRFVAPYKKGPHAPACMYKALEPEETTGFVVRRSKFIFLKEGFKGTEVQSIAVPENVECLLNKLPKLFFLNFVEILFSYDPKSICPFTSTCKFFYQQFYGNRKLYVNELAIQKRWNVPILTLLKVSADFIFTNASNYVVTITACDKGYDEDSLEEPDGNSLEIKPWQTVFLDFSVLGLGNIEEKWVFAEVFPRKKGDLHFYSSAKMRLKQAHFLLHGKKIQTDDGESLFIREMAVK